VTSHFNPTGQKLPDATLGVDSGRRVGQLGGAMHRHHGGYGRVNPPLAVLMLLQDEDLHAVVV
jgi:hypothetical protein